MDPNETLAEMRAIFTTSGLATPERGDLERLVELAQDMDEWITRGGFLPRQWATPLSDNAAR